MIITDLQDATFAPESPGLPECAHFALRGGYRVQLKHEGQLSEQNWCSPCLRQFARSKRKERRGRRKP